MTDTVAQANAKAAVTFRAEPTRLQCLVFAGILLAVCALIASFSGGYLEAVSRNGDNSSYAAITSFILHPSSAPISKHFWGLPYCAAVLSPFGLTPLQAIALISLLSTLGSALLVFNLWSGWVSLYFIALNYTLIQFGAYGGSDPLFVFLVLLGYYLARRQRWVWAAIALSCAVTVRPVGVFMLVALGVQLLMLRQPKTIIVAAFVSALVLGSYFTSMATLTGDALKNIHGYATEDWNNQLPVGLPLEGLIANFGNLSNIAPPMLLVKLTYALAHLCALLWIAVNREARARFVASPYEALGAIAYSAFIICYNAPGWALSIYPRLLIPVSPLFLSAFSPRLPRHFAWVITTGAVLSLLAIGSNVGYGNLVRLW